METKRLILAIALAVTIFVAWNLIFPPPQRQEPVQTATTTEAQPETIQSAINYGENETPLAQTEVTGRIITVDHPMYVVKFDEKGARIVSFQLKDYREQADPDSSFKELLPSEFAMAQVGVNPVGAPPNSWNNALFEANTADETVVISNDTVSVTFSTLDQNGIQIDKTFIFKPDTYVINFDTFITNLSEDTWNNAITFELEGINQGAMKRADLVAGTLAMFNGKDEKIKTKKKNLDGNFKTEGMLDWIASQDRYFIMALIPNIPYQSTVTMTPESATTHVTSMTSTKFELKPGEVQKISNMLYFGPKEIDTMKAVGHNLSKAVDFGFFSFLAKPFLWFMKQIYQVIPNYGIAIIILTIIIKFILFPLGSKSYKSMSQMKKLQPLIKEIQRKYKDDKMRMNQETMALYKTYKVNPMKGCLPMIVQIPVFFALYRMLYSAIELRHAPFFGWINDLSAPDRLFDFGFSIPFMEAPTGIPVMTLLMGASMFLQQKMSPPMGDPAQQKMLMILMPVMFTVIFVNFSSGLVLYWFINNLFSITQQYYIQKKVL